MKNERTKNEVKETGAINSSTSNGHDAKKRPGEEPITPVETSYFNHLIEKSFRKAH